MRPRSRSFDEARGELLGAVKSGLSLAAAAELAGVAPRTAEYWLMRGRREPDSPYAEFLAAVDAARGAREMVVPSGAMDEAELRQVVSRLARAGNVQAAKLLFDMLRVEKQPVPVEAVDPLAPLDELAAARVARRTARGAS